MASAREHHERVSAPEERSEDCQLEPARPESAPTCAEVQREQGLGKHVPPLGLVWGLGVRVGVAFGVGVRAGVRAGVRVEVRVGIGLGLVLESG